MQLEPDRLATLMSSLGSAGFARALLGLFNEDYQIVHCAAYERDHQADTPRMILAGALDDTLSEQAVELGREWMREDCRVDPILVELERHAQEVPSANYFDFPATRAPERKLKEMIERYYEPLNMGEEVTYMLRRGERMLGISLYRDRRAGTFHAAQRESLSRLSALMLSSAARHAQLSASFVSPSTPAPSTTPQAETVDWPKAREEKFVRLRAALLLDERHLTLREAEICAYIVLGHTAIGISLMLGISLNTVATHRKRAYAKLGISSQTELFNICLKHCI